ncbi:MAG TPA: alkaline phosphatase D family protein [Polyangiales bacterium]|nr:alkaline phosphatase D family protein [Polyangiales bacterium]
MTEPKTRRDFLVQTGLASAALANLPSRVLGAPTPIASGQPVLAQGIQIGDPAGDRAIVWSRADRAARLFVEWDTSPRFGNPRRVRGPYALESSDFTARVDLADLPRDREIFVRASFEALDGSGAQSEYSHGRFQSTPLFRRGVRFVWSGDTAGQGYGINLEFGGMKIYEAMRQRRPDFFLHSGDTIYADGVIPAQLTVEEGKIWNNVTTPEKSKVAETLDEFRGAYRYNLLDENVRRFNAEVAQIWQWDDHEVTNNWSASKSLSANASYTEKSVALLAARGTRAFLDYAPLRPFDAEESERVYRHIPYGCMLDVFVLDMRSYRNPNGENLEPAGAPFLGAKQLAWLKHKLRESRAVWKVIAADMPIGLQVPDGTNAAGKPIWEAIANGEGGAAVGRELEIAELLRFIKRQRIANTVWLTADVHYCAAHHYSPERAAFTDFEPFWEFVGGPLNAGSFGPNKLDATFGPEVVFQKVPPAANASPYAGFQFFGQVDIDERSAVMTVQLVDLNGTTVFTQELEPRR